MERTNGPIRVRVFAPPDASCGHGMTWSAASAVIRNRLGRRFGGEVTVEHIEMFTPPSFAFQEVLDAIEAGAQLPVVQVEDRIVSQGGKLSEALIARAVKSILAAARQTRRRNDDHIEAEQH